MQIGTHLYADAEIGSAVTNAELAKLLNDRLELTGVDAVSANVIRQWVGWEVLPKSSAKGRSIGQGPAWSRPETAMRRALRLAELRRQGLKRETAVIVQAYIEWGHPDFERVRESLLHELSKWGAQLTRPQITFLDGVDYRELSNTKKRAIAAQLGPLDGLFKGTQFEQEPELYAAIAELARTGNVNAERLSQLIENAFERILPGVGQYIANGLSSELVNAFSGITGTSDEIGNAAQWEIGDATERQFRSARYITRLVLRAPKRAMAQFQLAEIPPAISLLMERLITLSPQTSTGPWAAFFFAQSILHERRGDKDTKMMVNVDLIADLAEKLFPDFDISNT